MKQYRTEKECAYLLGFKKGDMRCPKCKSSNVKLGSDFILCQNIHCLNLFQIKAQKAGGKHKNVNKYTGNSRNRNKRT